MRASPRPSEIDLRRAAITPDLEVLDGSAPGPADPEPPLRLFAGFDDLPEPSYLRQGEDRIGSAGLWRALESL